ncbi:hypothetical protein ACLOJK_003050 [Asimina triloba]
MDLLGKAKRINGMDSAKLMFQCRRLDKDRGLPVEKSKLDGDDCQRQQGTTELPEIDDSGYIGKSNSNSSSSGDESDDGIRVATDTTNDMELSDLENDSNKIPQTNPSDVSDDGGSSIPIPLGQLREFHASIDMDNPHLQAHVSCKQDRIGFVLTKLHDKYRCSLADGKGSKSVSQGWIADAIESILRINTNLTVGQIMDNLLHQHSLSGVGYYMVRRAKDIALDKIRGTFEESFGRLPSFMLMSIPMLPCLQVRVLGGCRPYIAVDDTFLEDPHLPSPTSAPPRVISKVYLAGAATESTFPAG